jgi:hypothetical protein
MSTARPDVKRVRSDQDHSKKDTKDREDKRQKSEDQGKEGEEKDNQDVDWLNEEPFHVGKSWDDWTTVWRQSCWCGKGESLPFALWARLTVQSLSCTMRIRFRQRYATARIVSDCMVSSMCEPAWSQVDR